MTENIPALIARVKDYPTITRLSHGEQIKMIETLRDALESLSAPPATDDEREALAKALYADYRNRMPGSLTWENDSRANEFRTQADRLLPLLSNFRRPSPLTRAALIAAIESAVPCDLPGWRFRYSERAADAILSRVNLTHPEPAEVEWGLSDSMLNSFPEPHFTTRSEESARMNQRRGHPAIKVVSRTVSPWVPVEEGEEEHGI